ncbi:internal scaffolding protein [Microviridae sp.]|nr:internal scaffolding protein [Microviridae sp.]
MAKFITAYGTKTRSRISIDPAEGRTEQHHKDECDVNNILKKYKANGVIQHVRQYEGKYGDFSGEDFQTAMNIIAEGKSMFESVPAYIRAKFDNDPKRFLDFVCDEANESKLVEMGLATQRELNENPAPAPAPSTTEEPVSQDEIHS